MAVGQKIIDYEESSRREAVSLTKKDADDEEEEKEREIERARERIKTYPIP